jgi:cell division transport system permease protein
MVTALRRYLGLHLENLLGALRRLGAQPLASLLTVLVIAIALALPAGLRVLVTNAGALSESWQGAADFAVYLKIEVSPDAAERVVRTIDARPDVESVTLIDRAKALEEFRAQSGFGEALDALEGNPLPYTLVVRPASGVAGDVAAVAAAIRALPEAELVQLDTTWVARLRAMLVLVGRIVDLATLLLAIAVAVVVGNTIRLEINSRAVEIEVVKLVGGTDAFIRRPFLYLGLWYGLLGAVVAAIVVAGALLALRSPVSAVASLYGSGFELTSLPLRETGILVAGGAILGLAGAWLATARHLRAIEPK